MPQIAQLAATYSSQIFWLLVTFGFVFVVVGLGMVPKVQSTMDARAKKIADDLASAKASFTKADELEEDWRTRENEIRAEAQAILAEAKAKAALETEAKLAEADGAIADKVAAAEAVVANARSSALAEMETVAAEAAAEMAKRVAGTSVTSKAANAAVKAAMANG
jgi:F-type H+-transporting ATPase subunit b